MAAIRGAVHKWWCAEKIAEWPTAEQKRMALTLFGNEFTEDKLAGVLALSEILLADLDERDLPAFAKLFDDGHIRDWNVCDWLCVKVLGRMVARAGDPLRLARRIAAWKSAVSLWQRRASCVAFVNLVSRRGEDAIGGLPEVVLDACRHVVTDRERFAQTAVGWVLKELSTAEPAVVIRFAEENAWTMSGEGMKYVTEKMAESVRIRLRALHKEDAQLRRNGRKLP